MAELTSPAFVFIAMVCAFIAVYQPLNTIITKHWIRHRFAGRDLAPLQVVPDTLSLVDRVEAVAREIQAGRSINAAIDAIGAIDCDSRSVNFVTQTLETARRAGPSSTAVLHGLAESLRRRETQKQLRDSQAATALLSARVLTWLPGIAGGVMVLMESRVRNFLLGTSAGWLCIVVALALNSLARFLMKRIINKPVSDQSIVEVVDALSIGLAATGSAHGAIEWAVQEAKQNELQGAHEMLRFGGTLDQALDRIQTDLGPNSAPLVAALRAHHRDGLPVTPTLDRIRTFALAAQERHVESLARRLPVRLSFPLVFLILPAFALLTVVPLIASAISSLTTPLV